MKLSSRRVLLLCYLVNINRISQLGFARNTFWYFLVAVQDQDQNGSRFVNGRNFADLE